MNRKWNDIEEFGVVRVLGEIETACGSAAHNLHVTILPEPKTNDPSS